MLTINAKVSLAINHLKFKIDPLSFIFYHLSLLSFSFVISVI